MSETPQALTDVLAPEQPPRKALLLTWRFVGGGEFTITAGADDVLEEGDSWRVTAVDGRDIHVYKMHVTICERRSITIRPKQRKPVVVESGE